MKLAKSDSLVNMDPILCELGLSVHLGYTDIS